MTSESVPSSYAHVRVDLINAANGLSAANASTFGHSDQLSGCSEPLRGAMWMKQQTHLQSDWVERCWSRPRVAEVYEKRAPIQIYKHIFPVKVSVADHLADLNLNVRSTSAARSAPSFER